MEKQLWSFVRTWVVVCILLATFVAILNASIDPYLFFDTPRVSGINARKSAVDSMQRQHLMKAYDVLRAKPQSVALGSSRVALGMDARSAAWPAQFRPVYNLGLAGGTPYMSYRYLQHAMTTHHLSLVVMGLDFEYFMLDSMEFGREFESYLAVTRDGTTGTDRLSRRIHKIIQATLSLDALVDSTATLAANINNESSDLVAGYWEWNTFHEVSADVFFAFNTLSWINYLRRDRQMNPAVMDDLRAILDLCEARGVRVVLYINPVHADQLEVLELLGYWRAFEDWKRDLVTLTAIYVGTEGRSRIQLWDFSGYDAYSTSPVPVVRDPSDWFWDSSHYTPALGKLVVEEIFGASTGRFGVQLTAKNIEFHVTRIREQQRVYRVQHQEDVRRVGALYRAVTSIPFRGKNPIL